jgi:MarR family transcriptional regulator for hemolysin
MSKPPHDTTTSLLLEAGRLVREAFRRRAQHLGLTQSQARALAWIAKQPGITQIGLAEKLEVHPVTVTQLIDRLQRAGWVRRETHEDDRRAFRLLTTDQAEPILDELWKIADAARAYALRGMSAAEQKQLDQFLLRIKRNLVDSDDEPESRG